MGVGTVTRPNKWGEIAGKLAKQKDLLARIGSYDLDETGIADGMVAVYDGASGKKKYVTPYDNPTFSLSEFANISEALTLLGTQQANLFIDVDVVLIGNQNIVIPENIIIEIKKGIKIISPLVARPLVGSVVDNYAQVSFEGEFYAAKEQIFEGDGLVWFRKGSVTAVQAEYWGIKKGSTLVADMNQNVKALQQAAISVCENVTNAASKKLKIGAGNIYMNNPVVFLKCGIENHPYLTGKRITGKVTSTIVQLEGAERIKHEINYGSSTNIFYRATYAAPFIFQGLRNSYIKYFRFEGMNDIYSKDTAMIPAITSTFGNEWFVKMVLRPDDFASGDLTKIGWISNNIQWSRHKPYAAIITDPFRVLTTSVQYTAGFSGGYLENYYGIDTHQNCWDVVTEGIHCRKFVSLLVQTLTGQQGDTFIYRDMMVDNQPFGISTCQDQSRDCKVYEFMAFGEVHSAFENYFHGNAFIGTMPEIISFHTAGGLKYIVSYAHFNRGIVNMNNIYAESFYAIGTGLGGNNSIPMQISDSNFSLESSREYTTAAGKGLLPRPPEIANVTFKSCMIGAYSDQVVNHLRSWTLFRNCKFVGCTGGSAAPFYFPLDAGTLQYYADHTNVYLDDDAVAYSDNSTASFPKNIHARKGGSYGIHEIKGGNRNHAGGSIKIGKGTYTFNAEGRTVRVDNSTAGNNFDFAFVLLNDIMMFRQATNDPYAICQVIEKGADYIIIGGFTQQEFTDWMNHVNKANPLGYVVNYNNVNTEFFGTRDAVNLKLINITYKISYTVGYSTEKINLPQAGSLILMPNGSINRVASSNATSVTLMKDYGTAFTDHVFVQFAKFIENKRLKLYYNGGNWGNAGIFFAGTTYDNINNSTNVKIGTVLCVKTGTFYLGSTPAAYAAEFIEFDLFGKPINHITIPAITPIKVSGNNLERPDAVAMKLPYGFLYDNTEALVLQRWDGAVWKNV